MYNIGSYLNDIGVVSYGFDNFDDSLVADYRYDIWRFAVSIVLDAKENGHLSDRQVTKGIHEFSRNCLKIIASCEKIDSIKT